ncbi:hypothetical protein VQ7734_02187 [Vibrio quintilis]|uniref:DUF2982 domain-containing protein n=2 Tax=Vibrio quintilis TaxID=1117707 RepID=A0A1M7YV10_9VIBR|nr:hypothetical protein VQ7734_02187 [Vibrio quintilis]
MINMQTVYFENFKFDRHSPAIRISGFVYFTVSIIIIMTANSFTHAIIYAMLLIAFYFFVYWMIIKSQVAFSLTATHFQQHLFRGGWIIKWNNICEINQCTLDHHGWHQPIPWIGIRLKSYTPYLESICPRIISEILLNQRGLLFLGIKQHPEYRFNFEDIVLDSRQFISDTGKCYTGLQAMLANRMKYQRRLHGYDLFISVSDLGMGRSGDELIGLARRYIAAAEPDNNKKD